MAARSAKAATIRPHPARAPAAGAAESPGPATTPAGTAGNSGRMPFLLPTHPGPRRRAASTVPAANSAAQPLVEARRDRPQPPPLVRRHSRDHRRERSAGPRASDPAVNGAATGADHRRPAAPSATGGEGPRPPPPGGERHPDRQSTGVSAGWCTPREPSPLNAVMPPDPPQWCWQLCPSLFTV